MKHLKIIADSGSTKTDWVIVDEEGTEIKRVRTIGFNPYFQTSDFIYQLLNVSFYEIKYLIPDIKEVYFYGAGCSSSEKNVIVSVALERVFTSANVHVNHDMIAASRATLGDSTGIACIIGTGSNSCVWNGDEILENIPSHGYIFGDEGSGSYLGIKLLKLYFSNRLSPKLKESFDFEFNTSLDEILNKTYKDTNPNVYLARFATFYTINKTDEQLLQIVEKGFEEFFEVRVLPYKNHRDLPLGFIGSISFHFQDILKKVADRHGVKIKSVAKCPIDKLVQYHLQKKIA
jgi:glucosamine kinase